MAKDTNDNSKIIRLFGARPVIFNKILADIGGGVIQGLFLSHLLYWHDKSELGDGWIYKTIEEFYDETRLTRRQQDKAIGCWKKKNVLKTELRGLPPKRYFKINMRALANRLNEYKGDTIVRLRNGKTGDLIPLDG